MKTNVPKCSKINENQPIKKTMKKNNEESNENQWLKINENQWSKSNQNQWKKDNENQWRKQWKPMIENQWKPMKAYENKW